MDDCNPSRSRISSCDKPVQIPLWTIVTDTVNDPAYVEKAGSDSSMDDCNLQSGLRLLRYLLVQIPLWTIVTIKRMCWSIC